MRDRSLHGASTAAGHRPYRSVIAGASRLGQLPCGDPPRALRLGIPLSFAKITENGALGDARQASEAFGLAVAEAVVTRSVVFLE